MFHPQILFFSSFIFISDVDRWVNSAKITSSIESFRFSTTYLPEDLDLDLQHSLGPIYLLPNCFYLIKTNQPRKEKIVALELHVWTYCKTQEFSSAFICEMFDGKQSSYSQHSVWNPLIFCELCIICDSAIKTHWQKIQWAFGGSVIVCDVCVLQPLAIPTKSWN